ncbi:MAG: GAF domain-containing protein [Deltaproteobacteria bacterium]|nr:GAF domain-containing protein [Deltaproteobacteria bacterium]
MQSAKIVDDKSVEILVAEDSPTQAEQLSHLLEEHGYKVNVATNGRKALEAARHRKPTLIISDIMMPEMDGFTLCKEIKAKKALRDIPVVLLTALSSSQDVIRGLQCGADNFIRKPYDGEYLLSRIGYLLANKELRKEEEKIQVGLKIRFNGEDYLITSERQQILNLLISTYEEAVLLNQDLAIRQKELARSYQSLNGLYEIAESLNSSRTPLDVAEGALEKAVELPAVKAGWMVLREGESGFRIAATQDLPPALLAPGALEGSCFCREKLLSGELDGATNVLECERLQKAPGDTQGLKYHATIPLLTHETTLGLLNLAGTESGLFSDAELKTLHSVGHQIAVALERAQLYENLEKKVEERTVALREEIARRKLAQEEAQQNLKRIHALHEVDLAITSTLDLKTVLDVLLEKIDLFFPYPTASTVRLMNEETGVLEALACRGLNEEEWKAQDSRSLDGRAKKVVEIKAPLTVRNVQTDPQTSNPEIFRKYGLVSHLGVPFIAKNKTLGVLGLYTKQEHEFSQEEIEFFSTLAGQAAIAIQNAQLYEEIGRSTKELELTNQYLERSLGQLSGLYTALTPLAPSESVHEMMDGIIARLQEATGADAVLIRLWDDAKDAFAYISHRGYPDPYVKGLDRASPDGAANWVFTSGEPIITSNIAEETRLRSKRQLEAGFHSCAILPLKTENRVRGLVYLASRQLGYFDEEQRDHLMAIARQMGIALENKDLFDNLRASRDELEKANKIKDEFLSVMSHELRTPLNVVVGYTGMIKDGLLGAVNRQQQEALGKVIDRANDQLGMVNNILYATVLETEKINIDTHEVSVGDFLSNLKAAYEAPINKDFTLEWDYPADLPVVKTDSAKLKLIMQNLIDNAIKFTQKGSVTVSARIGVGDQGLGGSASPHPPTPVPRWVEFKVSDTGVGIPKDAMPFIFDKFHQVDSSETRLFGGVGMGLYIVKKFTELLNGTVEVESEVGKGSTFIVKIPYES